MNFINRFCTLEVVDFSKLFSDVHCPLSISVYATNVDGCEVPDYIEESVERIRKWDSEKLIEFQQNINQGKIKDLLYNLKEPRVDVNVNIHVEKLCEILIESAKATFGISHSKNGKTRQKSLMNKPWFNRECKFARQNYRKFRRKFKKIELRSIDPIWLDQKTYTRKLSTKIIDYTGKIFQKN